ncbi:LysR family transcriptional regulator [Pikeienuella piscinae]|uniref:LysR family transcriptional regulator n=1 Tax=Pikeienuella piscinae TaxID=2748098 RepID=A0A7L5BUY4_9RHOB|nr:LysR family transcriptional regulator [Pikeienuella piscinae]QIE55502.1 LysR family transcriptional regulator [Pikeienuella piscinae]
MPHNGSWDDLRVALAVADAGSVNAAAKALGLNHATVLRRINAFERRRGFTLFERSARGASVAPSAAAMIERLRAVEAAIDGFERAAAGADGRLSGSLRLTSTDSLVVSLLPPHLAAFRAAYPKMSVTLAATNARLDLGRLDAEMTVRPAQALPENLVGERVGAMRMRVWGSAAYLSAHPSGDPADHVWLGVSELLSRSPVHEWQQLLPKSRIAFRADSFVTLAALARDGIGLACIPDCLATGLTRAAAFSETFETGVWVAAHRDLAETPRILACRRFFAAALRADPVLRAQ